MIARIVLAVVVAAIVGLLLAVVLGPILVMTKFEIIVFFGRILEDWGWPIGVVAGIWYFFRGGGFSIP